MRAPLRPIGLKVAVRPVPAAERPSTCSGRAAPPTPRVHLYTAAVA